MMTPTLRLLAGSALCAMISAGAFAQSAITPGTKNDPRRQNSNGAKITAQANPATNMKDVSDEDDLADSYQPKGIDLGNFLFLPKVELDNAYNDNIYAERRGKNGDFITSIRPEFRLRSQFTQHSLNFYGMAEANKYWRYNNDDHINGQFGADGRYDISSTTELTGGLEFNAYHEDRGSDDAVNGRKPTAARTASGRLGGKTQLGSFTYSLDGTLDRRDFDDVSTSLGTRINNDDRDRTEYKLVGRGAYEFYPGYSAVVALTGNSRDYDARRDDFGFNRDSSGYRAEAGIGLDISQVVRGDFLVGYMAQNYQDRNLRDVNGLAVRASLNWTPTRMTLVVPTLERSVSETTTANASGMVRTTASVLVRHELARNLLFTGYGGVYLDDYRGTNESATTYELRARLTYAFDANVYLSGEISHKTKDSNATNRSFDQNFIGLRLGIQM